MKVRVGAGVGALVFADLSECPEELGLVARVVVLAESAMALAWAVSAAAVVLLPLAWVGVLLFLFQELVSGVPLTALSCERICPLLVTALFYESSFLRCLTLASSLLALFEGFLPGQKDVEMSIFHAVTVIDGLIKPCEPLEFLSLTMQHLSLIVNCS